MPLSLLEGLPSSLLDAVCLPSSNAACRRRRRMSRKPAGQRLILSDDSYGKPARMCPQRNNQEKLIRLGCSVGNHTTPAITAASSRRPAMAPTTAPTMAPVFDPLPLGRMPAPRLKGLLALHQEQRAPRSQASEWQPARG